MTVLSNRARITKPSSNVPTQAACKLPTPLPGPTCPFVYRHEHCRFDPLKLRGDTLRKIVHLIYTAFKAAPFFLLYGAIVGLVLYWESDMYHMMSISFIGIYLCITSICSALATFKSHDKMQEATSTNWKDKYINECLDAHDAERQWESLRHVVILPNYKEDIGVLVEVLQTMASCEEAKKIIVVLGMEDREAGCRTKAGLLEESFSDRFHTIISTYHPADLPGELNGKASNSSWAFLEARKQLQQDPSFDARKTIMTVMDADSFFHPKYFACVMFHFLTTTSAMRDATFWQPYVLPYINYFRVPTAIRLTMMTPSTHEITCYNNPLGDYFPMFACLPFSTYSISYQLADALDGWDTDFVAEDHHMFFKANTFGPKAYCETKPIHIPVTGFIVDGDGFFEACRARFAQATRHAMGFQEISYTITSTLCGLLSPFRGMLLTYKCLHMHYIMAWAGFYSVCLNVRFAILNQTENVMVDPTYLIFSVVVLPCLAFGAILLCIANMRLVSLLLDMNMIEKPQAVHGEKSISNSLVTQTVKDIAWILTSAPAIHAGFHLIPGLRACVQLLDMRSFVYVVAPKPLNDIQDSECMHMHSKLQGSIITDKLQLLERKNSVSSHLIV